MKSTTQAALLSENAELRMRLEAAEAALYALRNGEGGAPVTEVASAPQVLSLQGLGTASNPSCGELLTREAEVRQLLEAVHIVRDRLAALVGSINDEARRGELALRENAELLNQAQEIAHLGSWELDLRTNQLTWSDEVYRIFGFKPQEFAATYEAFLDRVHPDDRAKVDADYFGSVREGRDTISAITR